MSRKFTTKEIERALRSHNGYVYAAARSLGCTPKTIYRRLSKVQYLQDALDEIRGFELDYTELKLHEAIERGERWAIALKLKTQGKDRGYSERTEVTGKEGERVVYEVRFSEPLIEDRHEGENSNA